VLAQALTRAVQPRFHGFLGQIQRLGDVLIAQLRDMTQDDDRAELCADVHQGILDRVQRLVAFSGAIGPGRIVGCVGIQFPARPAQRESVEAFVDRNAIEPAVEPERRIVVSEVLKGLEEGRLATSAASCRLRSIRSATLKTGFW